ncbi:MAG: hypothetical protein FJ290_05890 [Planctomycetes bacterium]|nr:hypothetical protein [Planctomycetota bacterium]
MKTMTLLCVLVLLGGVAAADPPEPSYLKRSENEIIFGTKALELRFRVADARCTLTEVVNKLAKRAIPIKSDDFAIGIEGRQPLRMADFAFRDVVEHILMPMGVESLELQFEKKDEGLQLSLSYGALGGANASVGRDLRLSAPKPLPIRQVDAWIVGVEGKAAGQGFGQPVLLDDTFWGLEFPGGHNAFANGAVKLTHYPGRTTDRFVSKTAVLGVAEPGRVAQRFQDYIASIQATPREQRLFVNYNTWWTLMPPTEKNCVELIKLFKEKLFDPHGETFDTFTIDDGWDKKETLWELVPERFPNGFGPLVEPLKAMKANLGLWLSPSSGYSHAPHLAKLGYEHNSNPWYCCQSGPKYRREIAERVTALAKQYDLAFYKFDGFCPSCEAKDHGHLPGPYAQEANIDAYIELMKAAKQAKPGIFLDPTCGMWLSPWWLPYCDAIWGSVSGDYPDIIVPAPIVRDSATTTRDAVFRQRVREHPGYPPSAIEHLGIIVITPEKWEDNAIAVVGRGCRLLTLYINPKFFLKGDRDWAFLASVLKWTRHNAATLGHTTLIGGDPFKREWYGYAHFAADRGIISLRNPFIEPQKVSLKLDESVGWTRPRADTPAVATIVYPRHEVMALSLYGGALNLTLQGYETMLIQLAESAPVPATLTQAGQAQKISPCKVESTGLALQPASSQIEGKCTAGVPEGTKATMHLLADPRGAAGAIECVALVRDKSVPVRVVRSGGNQAHSKHPWTWFEFDIPAGKSDVAVSIKPAKGGGLGRCEAGWWLWAEHPVVKGEPPKPSEPLPLPIGQNTQREVITIQAAKVFTAPRVWPKADAPNAWLDELPPDDVTLGWGKLQTNQSVWEKPMTIAGKKFDRGLGTHAESRIVYDLAGGRFKTFRCLVGRDEHAQEGTIAFQVKLDGKVVFDSGPMTKASAAKPVEIDVSRGTTLELLTLDGGDGVGGDHGDWAEAELRK